MTKPCATCATPHRYGPDGWYADNGHGRHAYRPAEPASTSSPSMPVGWRPAQFGLSARCPHCACLVDNRPADINHHAAHCGADRKE